MIRLGFNWTLRILGAVFKCSGTTGHGSLLHSNTAAEKARIVMNRLLDYRATQVSRLESDPSLRIGDVTTVNLTTIHGGVQDNVVPPEINVGFDMRLSIDLDRHAFYEMVGGGSYLPTLETTTD